MRNKEGKHLFKKNKSLTMQMAVTIVGLVAGTVLLCWFLNSAFLKTYYVDSKEKNLLQVYEMVNTAAENQELEDADFNMEKDRACMNWNIDLIVMSPDHKIMVQSSYDTDALRDQLLDIMLLKSGEILEETQGYQMIRYTDGKFDSENIALVSVLTDGSYLYLKTPIESIEESVSISNKFLCYVGILATIIGALVSYAVTRKITQPILELTDISKRMTNLEFDAKYISRDENEIDLLGEHMNQLSENLEETISALKTANNELLEDNERKTQVDEMRKEFLSNVSHELKTPIALIQGYAEGLAEGIQDDKESRDFYCEVIMDEAKKMNLLVKKLLTLNQLEFGNDVVAMERFDLTELIKGVINASTLLLKQKEITLTFTEDEPIYVWADEFKVEEVVTNYLSNAINHCEGEKKIDIKVQYLENGVRVSVFNTGTPIPQEDIENVWVKFYKVDKARTREYGGSGIGLSIVKAIMDSFHKECGVVNYQDGVEFWFELDHN